jgi:DNA-binding XRE family transcriptional regulator
MKMKKDKETKYELWDDFRKEIFTEEEIAENDLKVSLICSIIEARNENGVTQKALEELSGVRQPIIARMESFKTDPHLSTVLKILGAIGKTLAIVPKKSKLA